MDTNVYTPAGPSVYGLSAGAPRTSVPSELHTVPAPSEGAAGSVGLVSLHNPLTWFAIIAAATLGLAAISTSVRVGPVKVSASAGK